MPRIQKKYIQFGTGTNDVNSRALPAHFTPTNYTPTQVASEGTDKVSAHLNGIDNKINDLPRVVTYSFAPTLNDDGAATAGRGVFVTGDMWYGTGSLKVWICLSNATGAAVWREIAVKKDINETYFSGANNQETPANVTGFLISSNWGAFEALVKIEVDAATDLRETIKITGCYAGNSTWKISQHAVGDNTGVVFTITNGGQIQYTSPSYSSFVSLSIIFKATVI